MDKGSNVERLSGVSPEATQMAVSLGDRALASHNAQLQAQMQQERIAADKWQLTQELDQRRRETLSQTRMKEAELQLTKGLALIKAKQAQAQMQMQTSLLSGDIAAAQAKQDELNKLMDLEQDHEHRAIKMTAAIGGSRKLLDSLAADGGKQLDSYIAGEQQKKKSLENIAMGNAISHIRDNLAVPSEQGVLDRNIGLLGLIAGAVTGNFHLGDDLEAVSAGALTEKNRGLVRSAIANQVAEVTGAKDPETVNSVVELVSLMHKMGYQEASSKDVQRAKELTQGLQAKGISARDLGRTLFAIKLGLARTAEYGSQGAAMAAGEYGVGPQGEPLPVPVVTPDFKERQKALLEAKDYVDRIQMGSNALGIPSGSMRNSADEWLNGANGQPGAAEPIKQAFFSLMKDWSEDGVIDNQELLGKLPPQLQAEFLKMETEGQGKLAALRTENPVEDSSLWGTGPGGKIRVQGKSAQKELDALDLEKKKLGQRITSGQAGTPKSVQMQKNAFTQGAGQLSKSYDDLIGGPDGMESLFGEVEDTLKSSEDFFR